MKDARTSYLDYWKQQGADVAPFFDVIENGTITPPGGAKYASAEQAFRPITDEMFLGRRPVAEALKAAEDAANAAIK